MRTLFLVLLITACGPELMQQPATMTAPDPVQKEQPLELTGNYKCTIEGVDTTVFCGGPVYRSDLRGQSLMMTVAQTGTSLQLGAFGVTLDGSLSGTSVSALHEDRTCTNCSQNPVRLQLSATAGAGQLRDVRLTLSQLGTGYSDCEKSYRGVCSRDSN